MIIFGQSSSTLGVQIDWNGAGWAGAASSPVGASTFPYYFANSKFWVQQTPTFGGVNLNLFPPPQPFFGSAQDLPRAPYYRKQEFRSGTWVFQTPPSPPFFGSAQDLPRAPYYRKQEFRSGTSAFQVAPAYLGSSKFLGYAVLGPPQTAVSVSKFVAYAVLQPVPLWRYAPYWPNPIPPRFPKANRGWINQSSLLLGIPSRSRGRTIFTYMG